VRFDSVRLKTGLRVHRAESGSAHGTPLLFLHGWPDSWFTFSRVLPPLPPALRAIAFDQRGFGESDHPESGYAISNLAADAVALLDALDIERATLVGHSYGSFVAREVATTHAERVAALVLIGTGYSTHTPATEGLHAALPTLPDPIPEPFAREFQASTAYRPLPPLFFDELVAESLKIPARLWAVQIDALMAHDATASLGKLRAPTLLLWGDHDALFSREDQDRFLTAVPGARLKVYEETGHCPNWERPEDVAADITDFVESSQKLSGLYA
jgi:pimeloyl-ACP methyl ester carboxylesterase